MLETLFLLRLKETLPPFRALLSVVWDLTQAAFTLLVLLLDGDGTRSGHRLIDFLHE